MTADLGPAARPRPVPSPEDRMTETPPRLVPTFYTWLDRTEHAQLDARAACAEQERDDARDDLQELKAHHVELHTRLNATENDLRSQTRALLEVAAERDQARDELDEWISRRPTPHLNAVRADRDRYRAERDAALTELGAAGEVLAVVRDAAERIERALAVYDTTPGETCSPPCTLPNGHPMECDAAYVPQPADNQYRTVAAQDELLSDVVVTLEDWLNDTNADGTPIDSLLNRIRHGLKQGTPPSSVPPRRAQEAPPCRGCFACSGGPAAQDDEASPRRLLDQAIDAALPMAGGRVGELLNALRRELAHVDAKRAEHAEREGL